MKKYNSIDIVKWIMAIFVIAIHTHPFNNIDNDIFLLIYNYIMKSAVPFFFMASSFLLFAE